MGIWAPNCAEWAITQFATAKLGAILVNINPSYRLNEVQYALKQSGCSWLVTAPQFKTSDYTACSTSSRRSSAGSRAGALARRDFPDLRGVVRLGEEPSPGMLGLGRAAGDGRAASAPTSWRVGSAQQEFDDPINIQFTSGTTGYPKGATLSHHNILNNGYFTTELLRFTDRDRLLIPVPLYHCFGMVMGNLGCVTHGATMIYPSDGFDPMAVLEAAQAERATALYGVPTMFIAELNHPDFARYDLSALRTGIMAGSPCPVEVMKQVQAQMHMREVAIAYGMTETSPVSTQTRIGAPLAKQVGTVGQVHPHVQIKIVDPQTGQVVPGRRARLLVVLGEDHVAVGVGDDVGDVIGVGRGVDGRGGAAGARDREVGEDPLVARAGGDADPLLTLDAQCQQARGEVADPVAGLLPGQRRPRAVGAPGSGTPREWVRSSRGRGTGPRRWVDLDPLTGHGRGRRTWWALLRWKGSGWNVT